MTRVKVALFGAGARGRQCLAALRDDARLEIVGFFDNDPSKWRTTIDGLPVLEPAADTCAAMDAIIVASIYVKPIVRQLTALGVGSKVVMSPPQLRRRVDRGAGIDGAAAGRAGDSPEAERRRLLAEAPDGIVARAAALDVDPAPADPDSAAWGRELACTICCNNYLAYATVLARSFLRHHPGSRFVICLVDRRNPAVSYPADPRIAVIEAAELGIDGFDTLAFKYDVLELNTAVKPFLLERLLRTQGVERLLYLDPDILVLTPLDELFGRLDRTPLLLTPHLTSPYRDEHHPREVDILRAGTYNLGFGGFAAHPQTWALLAWWQERLRDGCTREVDKGFFVDQKWMDLVPSFFPEHEVIREPGYNAAYWNLHERAIDRDGDGFLVNGQPLHFFHFSGIDVHDLDAVSKHQSRCTLPARGGLRDLFELYRVLLLSHGHLSLRRLPYTYGCFANGVPVPDVVRTIFREAHLGAVHRRPFAVGDGSFYAWLRAPWTEGSPLSNLFAAIFARTADLKAADPRVNADADVELLLQAHVVAERFDLPEALMDVATTDVARVTPVAGPTTPADAPAPAAPRRAAPAVPAIIADGFSRAVAKALAHVDPDRSLAIGSPVVAGQAPEARPGIEAWLWDASWPQVASPAHEIWVPSTYALEGASRQAQVPVVCVPLPAGVVAPSLASRDGLGLPEDGQLCAAIVDAFTIDRIDLHGTCRAFADAVADWPAPGPVLVVGMPDRSLAARVEARLHEDGGAAPSILVRTFTPADLVQLLRLSDAYVALHEEIAWDPWLAHALWHGRPAITTGVAGTSDLATPNTSYLVRTRRTPDGARADSAHAVAQLRTALHHDEDRRARGARGLVDVRRTASVDAVAAVMARRLRLAGRRTTPAADGRKRVA